MRTREVRATTQAEFSATFKGSPMKRAKLRGLKWSDTRKWVSSGSRSGAQSKCWALPNSHR
jgi:hypothetical protein